MGNVHPQDLDLVNAVLRKERAAFDRFFDAYFPRLFRFCRTRMADERACEDVVQESLIKALRGLHNYRGDAALFTWLCQIARNEMANWHQKLGRQEAAEVNLEELESVSPRLLLPDGDGASQDDAGELVQRTLQRLPDNYCQVLELKYFEGLSVSQIAATLATGEIAVQSLLARARRAFRDAFSALQEEVST
ncbi:MAG: RNA polymerase sigma factor [Pseudomonadales bacterium]|nr:RNA polymerase sigma factor [Pseudomonadales bacterium]